MMPRQCIAIALAQEEFLSQILPNAQVTALSAQNRLIAVGRNFMQRSRDAIPEGHILDWL